MKIQEVLTKTTQFFKDKKIPSARLDAELLIASALKIKRIELYLKFDQPMKEDEVSACREVVRRRGTGEPVAYILNEKGFFGLDFFVDERVLIPRPESELLVEEALKILDQSESPKIMDLGSGSGCLAISILAKLPSATAVLVDRSAEALEVAKMNADKNAVMDRCEFIHSSVQDINIEAGSIDLIVANPPYIRIGDPELHPEVEKFEPHVALFGGETGLDEVKAWLPKAMSTLRAGGQLLMEIGADQGAIVKDEFQNCGFLASQVLPDLSGRDRIVTGRKE